MYTVRVHEKWPSEVVPPCPRPLRDVCLPNNTSWAMLGHNKMVKVIEYDLLYKLVKYSELLVVFVIIDY